MKNNAEKIVEIYYRYYDELALKAFMIIGDNASVNDIMQEVAVTLIEKQDELEQNVTHWRAYLHSCVKNASIDLFRQNKRLSLVDSFDTIIFQNDRDEIKDHETITFLKTCLESYEPKIREAFLKHILDRYPIRILAQELNISPNALSKRFKRMRQKVAEVYLISTVFYILLKF